MRLGALFLLMALACAAEDLESLLREGLARYGTGEIREAIAPWERGLKLARESQDELFAGSFLGNLGIAYAKLGEYQMAADVLEESLKLARGNGDRQGEKSRLNSLGGLYLLMEKPVAALPVYRRALEIAIDLEDKQLEADVLSNLGMAYGVVGNYGQAISHLRRAIEMGDDARKARNSVRLAVLMQDAGDPRAALAAAHQAKDLMEKSGDTRERDTVESVIAASSALVVAGETALDQARIAGLEEMLARLRKYGQRELASQVRAQLEELQNKASR